MSVSDQITVVVCTSPIPSCPSTRIIDVAITSVQGQLSESPIIISADGVDEVNLDYADYVDALVAQYGNVIFHHPHVHQSGMLQTCLDSVKTPLLLYWEGDWELLPDVPWAELSQLILSGELNYIKLHANPRISPYYEHLMCGRAIYQQGKSYPCYNDAVGGLAVPIVQTRQWSQNPHLASTELYRREVLPRCEGKCEFIENLMHGPVANSPWEAFRCGIYNPVRGDMYRIRHLDGRGSK